MNTHCRREQEGERKKKIGGNKWDSKHTRYLVQTITGMQVDIMLYVWYHVRCEV